MTLNTPQPPLCFLEINEYGIKMRDKESVSAIIQIIDPTTYITVYIVHRIVDTVIHDSLGIMQRID